MPNIPQLINSPWMIEPNYFNQMMELKIDETLEKKAEIYLAKNKSDSRQRYNINNNNALIPIMGPLFQRDNLWSWFFDGSSYEGIGLAFNDALENSDVKTIIFEIDSPGGVVSGVFDLVDEISTARGKKEIIAVINEKAYSAAYAIASAAHKIYIPRTGGAGSIGVIALHADYSKLEEKIGVKYTPIFNGERKNDFTPHEPLSNEAYKVIKAKVDEIAGIFHKTVAKNRGLGVKAIKSMEAGIFQGKKAVDIGLADGIKTFTNVIKTGGKRMSKSLFEAINEAIKDASAEDVAKAMAELGYVPKTGMMTETEHKTVMEAQAKEFEKKKIEAVEAAKIEGREEGGKTVKLNVITILELCSIGGLDIGLKLISEGATVEEAKKKILEEKAKLSGQQTINSTVNPMNSGEPNPMIAEAERRAKEAKK